MAVQVFFQLEGQVAQGGPLSVPSNAVTLADLKKVWHGPQAVFEARQTDVHGRNCWLLLIHDHDSVPVHADGAGPKILARVRIIEPPNTIVHYTLEGHWLQFSVEFEKPASRVTLLDVKTRFAGSSGAFLFKTPDLDGGYHWTVLSDLGSGVPAIDQGKIEVQVKMKGLQKTIVQFEHEGGGVSYLRLGKPAAKVTLLDLKAFVQDANSIFHFKVTDPDGSSHWAVWLDESMPVPALAADLILVRTRPFGRAIELQTPPSKRAKRDQF